MPGTAAVTGPEPTDDLKSLGEEDGQEALHAPLGFDYYDGRQITVREQIIDVPAGLCVNPAEVVLEAPGDAIHGRPDIDIPSGLILTDAQLSGGDGKLLNELKENSVRSRPQTRTLLQAHVGALPSCWHSQDKCIIIVALADDNSHLIWARTRLWMRTRAPGQRTRARFRRCENRWKAMNDPNEIRPEALIRKVDSVQLRVPDLESGLALYRDKFDHDLIWRSENAVGLRMPEGDTEIVLQLWPKSIKSIRSASPYAAARLAGTSLLWSPPLPRSNVAVTF